MSFGTTGESLGKHQYLQDKPQVCCSQDVAWFSPPCWQIQQLRLLRSNKGSPERGQEKAPGKVWSLLPSNKNNRLLCRPAKSYPTRPSCPKGCTLGTLMECHPESRGRVLGLQSYGFSSSHVQMWEPDPKEGWATKIDTFELRCWRRLLRVPWITRTLCYPVHPKGNQPWMFIGRTDAEAEAPILWPPDAKNRLIGEDPDAGKDWRQEEKGTTEDQMVGWHHQLDGQSLSKLQEIVKDRKAWCVAVHGVKKNQTRLSIWTTTIMY